MLTHLPLERLFAQLKDAGFHLDTRRKLRLWLALREKGGDYVGRMAELKYLLAPLVATTGGEQERFYGIWEAFWAECEVEATALEQETEPAKPIISPKVPSQRRVWWVGIALILSIIAAVLIWKYPRPEPERIYPMLIEKPDFDNQPLRESSTLTLRQGYDKVAEPPVRWEIRDAATGRLEHTDTSHQSQWVAKGYGTDKWVKLSAERHLPDSMLVHIHCANPPRVDTIIWPETALIQNKKYVFEVKAERGASIFWIIGGGSATLRGPRVEHAFEENENYVVTCFIARPDAEADCYQKITKTFAVGKDKPFLRLAELQYDQPRLLRQLAPWLWLLLLLPLFAAAWLFRRWLQKRLEKPVEKTPAQLAADYPVHDSAPYFIPYRPQDGRIITPAAFFRMAEVLCRREEDERRQFDAPASVQATIAGGGFPAWRERAQTSPPDYLFLVTRSSEQDQQGRLFERLTTFLEGQDAPLTVFFHDGDFRHFWSADQPSGVSADWVSQQYPDHQLVLLGDGHGLLNPYDTRRPALRQEAGVWLRWRKRLLLSPVPVAGWTYPEVLLHQHFLLYPADTEGLLDGIEALDALDDYEPEPFPLWEAELGRLRTDQNDRYNKWETVADHRDFLRNDPAAFRWLCGLAVTTQPDYALTLAIGQALDVEITHDRLLRLSRIPWLRSNEPAHDLRIQLLALLSPEEEAAARRAVETELEAARDQITGSFAETDWRVHLAIHRFALEPHNAAHKQLIRELRQLGLLSGAQEAELDWVVQHRIPDADPVQTRDLAAWLDTPVPKPFWTKELWGVVVFGLLTLALVLGGWQYNRAQAEQPREGAAPLAFWQVEKEMDDEALRLHNLAVGIGKRLGEIMPIAYERNNRKFKIRNDSVQAAISLFDRAVKLRNPYPLASNNWRNWEYNEAAQHFNSFLSDSSTNYELVDVILRFQEIRPQSFSMRLASLHGKGLGFYYLSKNNQAILLGRKLGNADIMEGEPYLRDADIEHASDSAIAIYRALLTTTDSTYFDSLRLTMPVNLETLLVADGLIQPPASQTTTNNWVSIYNALPLRTLLLTDSTNRPGLRDAEQFRIRQLKGLVLHWSSITTKGSNARSMRNYFNTAGRTGSVHYLVDDKEAINIIPPPEIAYHVGANNYKPATQKLMGNTGLTPNYTTLGLTYCVNSDANRDKTYQNTIVLTAHLLKQNRLTINDLYRHSDLAGKDCPADFLDDGLWAKFKTDVQQALSSLARLRSFADSPTGPNRPSLALPTMIPIPGGTLTLGCTNEQGEACLDDEKPPHLVTLSDYAMSRTEVTNEQFAAFLNDYGSTKVKSGEYAGQEMIAESKWGIKFPDRKGSSRYAPQPGYAQHTVAFVSWFGAYEYCRWLSTKTGKNYRLPTEAEWEYAARGGQKAGNKGQTLYAGSDNVDEVAWYIENINNINNQTYPVAQKKPNALGLYDMSGNVEEWCSDWYGENYYNDLAKGAQNPAGPTEGANRVLRGGSWFSAPQACRAADRNFSRPSVRSGDLGFRLAASFQ